jgi:hypothetical protein
LIALIPRLICAMSACGFCFLSRSNTRKPSLKPPVAELG